MAIPSLPISEYPDVVPPSVQVTAIYPGANPRTIADTVAGPLEEAVNGVENMIYMKSTSSSDGQMQLPVTFKGGTDIDLAAMQVQNRVAQAHAPPARSGAHARRHDRQGVVNADDGRAPRFAQQDLRRAVPVQLRQPARARRARAPAGRRPGARFRHRQLRDARLDRPGEGRLARRSRRSTSSTRSASRTSRSRPAASAARRRPKARSCRSRSTRRGGSNSPEAFGEIVLKADGDQLTRLKDVARIELGANTYAIRSLLNNEDAAAIAIFEAPGANTIELSDAIRERMKELEGNFPEDVHWSVVYDPTVFVQHSIDSVIETLLEAIAAGRDRRRAVPADLARLADPAGRGAGVDHRQLRRAVAARVLDQRADAVRPRARDRHRGGRRDRRGRERRAAHRSPARRRARRRTRP